MKSDLKEQVILRQYLLGELSDESRQRVEERLLTDGDFLEELAITEEELIDQYLSGNLTAPEREHFEAYFLTIPERHKKLAFARAFKKYVANKKAADLVYPPTPTPRRGFFPAFFGARNPVLSYSLAAALLLLVGVSVWLIFIPSSTPSYKNTFAVVLNSGATRADGQMQRLTIPPDADAVNLQLETTQGDYTSYRATLLTDEAREVFTQSGLKAQTANNSRLVNFIVPAKKIPRGDYQVKLSGQSAAKGLEELDSYAFRVTQ